MLYHHHVYWNISIILTKEKAMRVRFVQTKNLNACLFKILKILLLLLAEGVFYLKKANRGLHIRRYCTQILGVNPSQEKKIKIHGVKEEFTPIAI